MALQYTATGNSATTAEGNEKTVTYAKEQLGNKNTNSKILGVYWKKQKVKLGVDFKTCKNNASSKLAKRSNLRAMASVYNPLGI